MMGMSEVIWMLHLPSGYLTQLWKMDENGPFIDDKHDDLPMKNCDFPVRYVKEPQGIYIYI